MTSTENLVFKIIIVGNTNTGKSALINRITGRIFDKSYTMTIGVDFATKHIEIERDGRKIFIKFQIWDTAGQESFRSITRSYYRDAAGVIIVYDLTNLQSYESLTQWIDDVLYYCSSDSKVIISGSKVDLNHIRAIGYSDVHTFCKNNTIPYIETSSKTGENVETLFKKLGEAIYDTYINKDEVEKKKIKGIKSSIVISKQASIINKNIKNQSCCRYL
jgi:small GTP-binding protein